MLTNIFFDVCLMLLLVIATVSDYQYMKIPNWISIGICALFLVFGLVMLSWLQVLQHIGVGAGVLVLTAVAFSFHIFGGGDAKLLSAAAVWAGPDHVIELLALTGLFGGALGVFVLLARKLNHYLPALPDRTGPIGKIAGWGRDGICPYGIAIALAAVTTLPPALGLGSLFDR